MTTKELGGHRDRASRPSDPTDGVYDDEISLWPVVRILWSYRRVIGVSISGILLLLLLWGFGTFVFQPVERRARLEFRLMFDGAARGEYPNGLIFSHAEFIGVPVLTEVYEINELERYSTYEEFKNGFYILAASRELDMLGLEYQAKLSDANASYVERVRLEEEFREKEQALQGSQYSLNFVESERTTSIPNERLGKVLNDVLAVWAEQATTKKGVLTYQGTVFTKNLLREEFLEADDYIVRVDILRGKVNRLISSLTALENLPGATILQVGEDGISLPEIRINLEDLMTYRLEPLTGYIWSNGLSRDTEALGAYLENRQFQITLGLREAEASGKIIEDSLRAYLAEGSTLARGSSVGGDGGSVTGTTQAGVTALIPQIGDSFLETLMAMGGETSDVQYRQELTDRIIGARLQMASLARETSYYNRMSEGMQRASGSPPEEVMHQAETRFTEIYDAVVQAIEQSNDIHTELSKQNLNPQTNLFTITNPFSVATLQPVTLRTLAPNALFAFMFGLLVVPLTCLIHYYFRRELLPARPAREPDVPQ